MTNRICRQLPLFNFKRLDILCTWIGSPSEMLIPFELVKSFHCSISSVSIYYGPESELRVKSYVHLNFSRASIVQFRASRYIMCLNRTSELKVMTIWNSRELPSLNFCASRYIIRLNRTSELKDMTFEFLEKFCCSISSVSIYCVPESDLRVKSNDHLNFSRASVVQFRTSQ